MKSSLVIKSIMLTGPLLTQLARRFWSQDMTASPKPSFWAPLRVGNTVVSPGNAGWITAKTGYPWPRQNCSHGLPAEKTGRGSLLNHPSCPPPPARWPNRSRDWTEPLTTKMLQMNTYNATYCVHPNQPYSRWTLMTKYCVQPNQPYFNWTLMTQGTVFRPTNHTSDEHWWQSTVFSLTNHTSTEHWWHTVLCPA